MSDDGPIRALAFACLCRSCIRQREQTLVGYLRTSNEPVNPGTTRRMRCPVCDTTNLCKPVPVDTERTKTSLELGTGDTSLHQSPWWVRGPGRPETVRFDGGRA